MNPQAINPHDHAEVSNIELFFDLVFVFTITQVAEVIVHHPDISGIGHALIELSVLAWMFGGYAWLTNSAGHLLPQCRIVLGRLVPGTGQPFFGKPRLTPGRPSEQ